MEKIEQPVFLSIRMSVEMKARIKEAAIEDMVPMTAKVVEYIRRSLAEDSESQPTPLHSAGATKSSITNQRQQK